MATVEHSNDSWLRCDGDIAVGLGKRLSLTSEIVLSTSAHIPSAASSSSFLPFNGIRVLLGEDSSRST